MSALPPPPPGSPVVEQRSVLAADAATVWAAAISPEGINHELGPWVRMSVPAGFRLTAGDVVLGERLLRSRVSLLGVLPFDYDDLTLIELEDGRRFLERSPMLSARVWQHERIVEPAPGGTCTVTDRVTFVPRVRRAARLHRRVVLAIFRHRHRRLRARYGSAPAERPAV